MEERGLKISRKKTEYLGCNEHQGAEIHSQGDTVKRVNTFTYLGSTLAEDGELDAEVTNRVQSGWKNWKRVSGVLCDRRMNVKIKGKVYRNQKCFYSILTKSIYKVTMKRFWIRGPLLRPAWSLT